MSDVTDELRRIAADLTTRIEAEENDYNRERAWGRGHRMDMHYWRAEEMRTMRRRLQQRASYLDRKATHDDGTGEEGDER
jgi:hypothetical protein